MRSTPRLSQVTPRVVFGNSSNVSLIDSGPASSFQGRSSTSCHFLCLSSSSTRSIDAGLGLAKDEINVPIALGAFRDKGSWLWSVGKKKIERVNKIKKHTQKHTTLCCWTNPINWPWLCSVPAQIASQDPQHFRSSETQAGPLMMVALLCPPVYPLGHLPLTPACPEDSRFCLFVSLLTV